MASTPANDEYLVLSTHEVLENENGTEMPEEVVFRSTDELQNENGHENDKTSSKEAFDEEDSSGLEDDDDDFGLESEDDFDEKDETIQAHIRQAALVRQFMRKANDDTDLPETVTKLQGPSGELVYLVGTAHFSKESCADVEKVISLVQPDAVVVELCTSRVSVLSMDEEELSNMSDASKMDKLKKCIKQKGILSGLVLYMMLHMSAHITKELKMAPGSEFRTALRELKKVPGCRLYLGDRPIGITLQRMLAALSLWQKLKFGFLILQELKPISPEDVEKMKQRDIFEQLLEEMVQEFPHVAKALVAERDIYLTGYLQKIMKMPVSLPDESIKPAVIVGVVGIGHTTGIKAHFDEEITEKQLQEVSEMPPPSRTGKMVKFFFKGVIFATAAYALYSVACWSGIPKRFNAYWAPQL